MELYEQETKLYKAFSHPARLAILDLLRGGEQCVCHMEAAFGWRQAYISQQLMVLREAGLLEVRREGLNIFYRVIRPEIFAVMDAMRSVTGVQPAPKFKISVCTCPNCAGEHEQALIKI
jgi:ArsR family transcriptional regulator